MARSWYERMSILDYSFLAFEGPTSYMHISALATFEVGSLRTDDGGIDIARIRRHVASRLPSIPRYRQRLAYVPIENRPVWIDDGDFDLAYHVRQSSVPRPGGETQLREAAARLLERPLNRTKPLWEMWVIEGVEHDRFVLLIKVHHCMVDGLAGAEILAALLSPVPDPHVAEPSEWRPRPAPSATDLFSDEVSRRITMSVEAVRGLRGAVRDASRNRAEIGRKLSAAWQLLRNGARRPTATPLNQRIGPYRRFHWTVHDLATIKEIKNHLGGTVNDVVLTVVAGAVGEFLQRRHFSLGGLDFQAAVPVSVRDAADTNRTGNRVSAWLFPLPIRERDPVRRYRAVCEYSARLKDSRHADGGEMLTQAAEWTSANVVTLAALVANQTQPFNLIVTNVPGPPIPLFLLESPMVAVYPQVPLFENQCLGIALLSYAGKLYWGFNADFDALPDVEYFVKAVERAFRELRKAAVPRASTIPLTRPPRSRRVNRVVAIETAAVRAASLRSVR